MSKHSKTLVVLWASGWFLVATLAGEQTPAKRPGVKPLFENERVRVIDVVWEPGAGTAPGKLPGDSTIGMVGVVVQGGTMEHVEDNGKSSVGSDGPVMCSGSVAKAGLQRAGMWASPRFASFRPV